MKPQPLRFLWGTLLFLLCGLSANAVSINGLSVVCKNNTEPYTVGSPGAGLTYKWTMSNAVGTYSATYGNANTVYWSVPGNTIMKIVGYNGSGQGVDSATRAVTVKPLPQPLITTDFKIGCQNFPDDTTKKGEEGHAQAPDRQPLFLDDGPCPKVCEDSWVTYTATGAPGSTFQWNVSGGTPTTASGNTITVHWGAIGMGSIGVTETTIDGCMGTRSGCIEIIGKPHALFGAMPNVDQSIKDGVIKVCLKQDVIFVDKSYATSSSPIVSWYWDFGDYHTYSSSTTANPIHQYENPGSYTAMLVVKNACNCTDTFRLKVEVAPEEGLRIVCASVVCEGKKGESKATYSLGDASIPCDDYLWSVTGGTILSSMPYGPSIDVAWDNVDDDGFGYVHFDASPCHEIKCPGVTTIKIPVIKQQGTIKGITYLCQDKQYKYSLPAWPGTVYNWSLSNTSMGYLSHTDQPNEIVVHSGSNPGTFTLICNYSNNLAGCSGIAKLDLNIVNADDITGTAVVCQGTTNSYHLFSNYPADWVLTAPDGSTTPAYGSNPSFYFGQPGLYSLNATGPFCIPNPFSIRVLPTPSAVNTLVGPDTVCVNDLAPIPYEFTAGNAEPGAVFQWQIVGGTAMSPLVGNKITVAFTGPGPYQIKVSRVGTQAPFCPGPQMVKTLYTPVVPINISGKDTVCPNSTEYYTGGYTQGDSYEWTLSSNAGSIDDNKQPNVHITWNNYTTPTPVTIKLKITKCGKDFIKYFNVLIQPAPVLSLGSNMTICSGQPFNLTLSSSPSLSSGSLIWYVDNTATYGPISLPASLTQSFTLYNTTTTNTSTTRLINVIVTSPNGCSANATMGTPLSVTVLPAPVALVTPVGPIVHCGAFSETLTATVQGGLGGPYTYAWSNSATGQTMSTSTYGNYFVTVTNTTNNCSSTSNTVQIIQNCGNTGCTISPAPTTSVTASQHCGDVNVNLTYSTLNYTGAPVSYSFQSPGVLVGPVVQTPGNLSMTTHYAVAGNYRFNFGIPYYDINGNVCIKPVEKYVVVPLIPELFYEINCSNGSGYRVKLLNHSNFYPGTAIDSFRFYLDNPTPVQTGPLDTWTSGYGISVGSHNAKMTVYFTFNGVHDSCSVSRVITLDPLPVANFVFDRNFVCVEQQAIQFNSSSSTGTISSYAWDFDDNSGILTPNPTKVYQTVKPFGVPWNVTLTVSNAYGCSSTATRQVTSVANSLLGSVTPNSPVTLCDGASVNLVYSPVSPSATSYTWMNGQNTLVTTPTNTLPVNQSGFYWVHVTDATHGCWQNTAPPLPVTVISVPDPIITGDSLQCAGNTFTLLGYVGNAPGIAYQWYLNGNPISGPIGTAPNLTQTQYGASVYDYQLKVTITQGSTVCSKLSSIFKVYVNNPPTPPVISFNVNKCDPYEIELTANPFASGTYNWSNGASGNPVIVNVGGPYKVWYTDNYGCTVSSAAIDVPKDPKGYLWIFPTGCYTKCPPITIPGPIIPFASWGWYHPDTPPTVISSGTNSVVTPLTIYTGGRYGMYLNNGYCDAHIDTMDLKVPDDCKPVNCDRLRLSIYTEGLCRPYIYITATNGYGISLPYTLGASIGTVGTMGGTLPVGTSYIYPAWAPPAGFTGGYVTFYITVTLPGGKTCTSTIQTYIKCDKPIYRGMQGNTGNGTDGSNLSVAPNPAQETTVIKYHYDATQTASNRAIEVYDVTGRKLATHIPDAADGSWTLKLDRFVPGLYQVVMKQGGTVTESIRLSIVK